MSEEAPLYYARLHPETDPRQPKPRRVIVQHASGNKRYTRIDDPLASFIETFYEVTAADAVELRVVADEKGVTMFEVLDLDTLEAQVAAQEQQAKKKRRARSVGRPLRSSDAAPTQAIFNDIDDDDDKPDATAEPSTAVEDAQPAAPARVKRGGRSRKK